MYFPNIIIFVLTIFSLIITLFIVSVVGKKYKDFFVIQEMWNEKQLKWLQIYEEEVGRQADPITKKYYNSRIMVDGFDIIITNIKKYAVEVEEGKAYMYEQSILVTGLLCNAESNIINIKNWFDRISKYCKDIQFIIIENNSSDNTRQVLQDWCDSDTRIRCLCTESNNTCYKDEWDMDNLRQTARWERIREMSRLRNVYIEYINEHLLYNKYDFMFVIDLDLRGHLYLDGIFHSFYLLKNREEIEAITCNGMEKRNVMDYLYYDSFAYIELFSQYVWSSMKEKQEHDQYVHNYITLKYSRNMESDKVLSAFGGFAIYRTFIFEKYKNVKYKYSPFLISCEHAHFHRQLSHVYVNPRMIYFIEKNLT